MTEPMTNSSCRKRYWTIAAIVGVVLFILFLAVFDWSFLGSLIAAIVLGWLLGYFLIKSNCKEDTQPAASASAAPAPAPAPEPTPPAEAPTPAAEVAEPAAPEAEEAAPAADEAPAAEDDGGLVKPSTPLPGQEDLASRKGSWVYQGDGASAPASAPAPAPAPAAEPAAEAVASPGTRPAALDGARVGGADDLKRIKGVGPKMEQMLNSLGFYHFDQIAAWTADEVAWVDDNLQGFKGRVSRDNWVDQATKLAAGEETEFSMRVDKGDVY